MENFAQCSRALLRQFDVLPIEWRRVAEANDENAFPVLWDKVRAIDHLEPFVFQTARNLALDHLRARKIHSRTMVDDVPQDVMYSVAAPASSAEDAAHAEQLLERLNVSLSQLSPRQQQIFILSRLHGHSYQEIAQELSVSLSTVQKELKLIMTICIGVAERLNGD